MWIVYAVVVVVAFIFILCAVSASGRNHVESDAQMLDHMNVSDTYTD